MDWDWLADHAPIATACFALVAGLIAYCAIRVQKRTARQRASVDFFVKTEMDSEMLKAYEKYIVGARALQVASGNATTMRNFAATEDYRHVRSYLNIHELLAVGLDYGVFDEDVCFFFWSDTLVRHCRECEAVLRLVRQSPDGSATYLNLRKLNARWTEKVAEWKRKHPVVPVA
jgi:hypothetical protein